MSIVFRPRRIVEEGKQAQRMSFVPHRSVKYVELFGSIASGGLGAGISGNIIDWQVPDGHCAELYALGVQPDLSADGTTSNLKCVEIGYDGKTTGIRFLCNHLGKNALPYGDPDSLQPIRLLDYPMRPGNLTIKYNEGQKIQIIATGKGALQEAIYARAKVLLYEEPDVSSIFGASISNFATLPGGVSQEYPNMIFADYVEDFSTTSRRVWQDAYSRKVQNYEQIVLSHIGVVPHAHADALKLFDSRLKWEAPEYEPYWIITATRNALPFGDDAEYQPTQRIPTPAADHVYTNTDLKVQVRDDGAGAATISVQLLGTYRRLR